MPIYISALLQNHGLTPKNYRELQKEGFDSTLTPLRLFESQLHLQASTKTIELPKLVTVKERAPTTECFSLGKP